MVVTLMSLFIMFSSVFAANVATNTVTGEAYSAELNSLEGVVVAAIPLTEDNQPVELLLAQQISFVITDATGGFELELPQGFSRYAIVAAKDGFIGNQVISKKGNHFIDLIMEESIPPETDGYCYCHHVWWKLYYACHAGNPCNQRCYYCWGGCY